MNARSLSWLCRAGGVFWIIMSEDITRVEHVEHERCGKKHRPFEVVVLDPDAEEAIRFLRQRGYREQSDEADSAPPGLLSAAAPFVRGDGVIYVRSIRNPKDMSRALSGKGLGAFCTMSFEPRAMLIGPITPDSPAAHHGRRAA